MDSLKFNLASLAVPAFFIFLGLEYLAAVRQKKKYYFNFESSASNIAIGIAERLMGLFLSVSFYAAFEYVYRHWALFDIPNTWYVWIVLILVTDLVWYWYHRLGHEINLLWAAHVVHHQSEEFNYTVSARITVFQSLIRNVFWCVLPFFGFHPAMVVTILVLHGTYSFFTHTRTVGKLGWLEYMLITPSHHRVHHGSDAKYLNKNYGDIFIFWDKIFGTFQREEEEPVYGLTHPLKSHSFVWQHFHYFAELAVAAGRSKNFVAAVRVIFGRPETIDPKIREEIEQKILPKKHTLRLTANFRTYLNVQLTLSAVTLFCLIAWVSYFDLTEKTITFSFIIITLINCGALIEQRTWIFYLEYLRLFLVVGLLSYETNSPSFFGVTIIWFSAFLLVLPVRRWYWKLIYDRDLMRNNAA